MSNEELIAEAGTVYHATGLTPRQLAERMRDHEEAYESHRHHVRRLDVIWNGEAGAAKQASLIDVVAQIRDELPMLIASRDQLAATVLQLQSERDQLVERVKELRETLRDAVLRINCPFTCGSRNGRACDCWKINAKQALAFQPADALAKRREERGALTDALHAVKVLNELPVEHDAEGHAFKRIECRSVNGNGYELKVLEEVLSQAIARATDKKEGL